MSTWDVGARTHCVMTTLTCVCICSKFRDCRIVLLLLALCQHWVTLNLGTVGSSVRLGAFALSLGSRPHLNTAGRLSGTIHKGSKPEMPVG